MTERMFAIVGDWALASDGVQWMLMRRKGPNNWRAVSFVRSERDILARCMREKGVEPSTAVKLLMGLPGTFDEWKGPQATSKSTRPAKHWWRFRQVGGPSLTDVEFHCMTMSDRDPATGRSAYEETEAQNLRNFRQ